MTNLKRLRLERGQSVRQFAIDLGVPFQSLYTWERAAASPHPSNAKLLRDRLGGSVEWLQSPTSKSAPA